MNVTLTPEMQAYIAVKVKSGEYRSADEVLYEAVRLLQEKDDYERKRAALIADIEEGLESVRAGRVVQTSAAEILAEVRARRAAE